MKLLYWVRNGSLLLGLLPYGLWTVIQIGETGDPPNITNNQLEHTFLILWVILFGVSIVFNGVNEFNKNKKIHLYFLNKFNFLVFGLILLALFFNYE